MGRLFDQGRRGAKKDPILLDANQASIVIQTTPAVLQRGRSRLGDDVQKACLQQRVWVERRIQLRALQKTACAVVEARNLGFRQDLLRFGI